MPGQGEVYDRLREPPTESAIGDPFYEDFNGDFYDAEDVECDDFRFLDDAQLYLDDYIEWASNEYGYGYDPEFDENYPDGIDRGPKTGKSTATTSMRSRMSARRRTKRSPSASVR